MPGLNFKAIRRPAPRQLCEVHGIHGAGIHFSPILVTDSTTLAPVTASGSQIAYLQEGKPVQDKKNFTLCRNITTTD